jgi:hypothetical protein
MSNPYDPSSTTEPIAPSGERLPFTSKRLDAIAMAVTVLAFIGFAALAVFMIRQALRLVAESVSLPVRLQADYLATASSSWVVAVTALVGIAANGIAFAMIRIGRTRWGLVIFGLSILLLVGVAILFKPT